MCILFSTQTTIDFRILCHLLICIDVSGALMAMGKWRMRCALRAVNADPTNRLSSVEMGDGRQESKDSVEDESIEMVPVVATKTSPNASANIPHETSNPSSTGLSSSSSVAQTSYETNESAACLRKNTNSSINSSSTAAATSNINNSGIANTPQSGFQYSPPAPPPVPVRRIYGVIFLFYFPLRIVGPYFNTLLICWDMFGPTFLGHEKHPSLVHALDLKTGKDGTSANVQDLYDEHLLASGQHGNMIHIAHSHNLPPWAQMYFLSFMSQNILNAYFCTVVWSKCCFDFFTDNRLFVSMFSPRQKRN